MTAISAREHEKFMEFVTGKSVPDDLSDDIQLLRQLYERYQGKLAALRRLVQEYETVQRRVRVELRKQQVVNAKHKQHVSE